MAASFQLLGRIVLRGRLVAVTGLHIGSREGSLGIGQAAAVLRDPLTYRPYIPGSSLRGKLRSLAERRHGFNPRDEHDSQNIGGSRIHACVTCRRGPERCEECRTAPERYRDCPVCPVFGITSDHEHATPTRLVVRDLHLSNESAKRLEEVRTELRYTEVKTEVAIDRVTAASNPRDIERVPAGAVFDDLELTFAVYEEQDLERFRVVPQAMALLEEDYLGGHGSRGYGKVRFKELRLVCKDYRKEPPVVAQREFESVSELVAAGDEVWGWLVDHLDLRPGMRAA